MKNMSWPLEYWMFSTNNEQTVGGGLMKRQQPQQTIINYFDVSSLDEYAKKVEGPGSRIKVPKNRGSRARLDVLSIDTRDDWSNGPERGPLAPFLILQYHVVSTKDEPDVHYRALLEHD